MDPKRLHYLVSRYLTNKCSKEELDEFLLFIKKNRDEQLLQREFREYWERTEADVNDQYNWDQRFYAMMKEAEVESQLLNKKNTRNKRLLYRIAAAAVVLLFVILAGYYLYRQNRTDQRQVKLVHNTQNKYKNDVPPGGNKAVLTLANGKKIILDSVHNGQLANQGNTKVIKINSGLLSYTRQSFPPKGGINRQSSTENRQLAYNTITTPPGGQYQIILPDGTKVWLNAASSLRFPTAFAGSERKVTLTGEAYFEVASLLRPASQEERGGAVPFIVKVNNVEVEVLGTHFNVHAYDDEKLIKTTLLEGLVRVAQLTTHNTQLIKPGEQASINKMNGHIEVAHVDTAEAVAWKNGFFQFNDTNLKMIMRQIARWYDVKVNYQPNMPERYFTGKMSRNVSLQHVLKVLELSNVHFKLAGNTITVMP